MMETILGLIGLLIVAAVVLFAILYKPKAVWIKKELVSLSLKSHISGSFTLGFGGFKDEMFYYIYIKEKDGGLTLTKLPMDLVKLYLDDSIKPHILMRKANTSTDEEENEDILYKLYVPTNTIKQEYNGDVK